VPVGDDQLDSLEPQRAQLAQELPPEDLVLRVPDIDAQNLAGQAGEMFTTWPTCTTSSNAT
jgi:hypothetical protein